jgi:hypothetical protein
MELTQEYFDKQLENLQTNITGNIDQQTTKLKQYVHESFKAQQVYIEERFTEIKDLLEMKEKVEKHELEIQQLKQQLKLV